MNQQFRKNLSELRQKKHLTQDELAHIMGVTRQAISKWERGEGMPDLYNVTELAKALDVTIDQLMGQQQTYKKSEGTYNGFDFNQTGGYLKKLLYKAKHTTNTEQAKKIKKQLLTYGAIGFVLGLLMIVGGFIGFATGAMQSVNNFGTQFNPLPCMLLFMGGGMVLSLSVYLLYGGFTIVIAGVTTKYLDTREKCPKCHDEIDEDEKRCSNCGYDLVANLDYRCDCGKVNQKEDKFCRECGTPLQT